jgi:hypothetical protein
MIALAPFLIGLYLDNNGLIMFGITIFWIVAIIGILSFFIPNIVWDNIIKILKTEGDTDTIDKAHHWGYLKFNIIYDLLVALILAFTGYGILAALYTLHIIGYLSLFQQVRTSCQKYDKEQEDLEEELRSGPE